MTTLAVGLLLLDGFLLLMAGWWSGRWYLAAGGAVLVLLSLGVVAYYRSYRRALAELERARDILRGEFKELRRIVEERDREPESPKM